MIKLFLVLSLLQVPSIESLFKAGDEAIDRGDWEEVSKDFNEILNNYGPYTLNVIGKTVCYWNIHIAEHNMGNYDKSSQALLGFITYGSDVIYHGSMSDEVWAMKFGLRGKLHHGYALLQARWAKINSHSCRSNRFACHINEAKLISVFEREMFCRNGKIIKTKKVKEGNIIIVLVLCDKGSEHYYFKVAK